MAAFVEAIDNAESQRTEERMFRALHEPEEIGEVHAARHVRLMKMDVVVVDTKFEVVWQCVDCESRWPASDDETALLLGAALTTIH